MRGQLWEPCPKCDADPVCVDCGYCRTHCTCASDAEARRQAREIEEAEPGFWARYLRYQEEAAQER